MNIMLCDTLKSLWARGAGVSHLRLTCALSLFSTALVVTSLAQDAATSAQDKIVLANGKPVDGVVSSYANGGFSITMADGSTKKGRIASFKAIQFNVNASPQYDRITFANGTTFTGQIVRYEEKKITMRDAQGFEKTGPVTMLKSIAFHQDDLSLENFPQPPKRPTPRPTANKPAARFNAGVLNIDVSRGDKNFVDGVNRKGDTIYYGPSFEDVNFKVHVEYKNPGQVLEASILEFYALGRDLANKKMGQIIFKEKFSLDYVDLKGMVVETQSQQISYHDNKYEKDHGIDFFSYLVVIKSSEGKMLKMKGSRSSVEKIYETLNNLNTGDSFRY